MDALGGDFGPSIVIPAALQVLAKYPALSLILVGDRDVLQNELNNHLRKKESRITIHHAS